jgi:HEAT repeat protein/ATP/ADP translocase
VVGVIIRIIKLLGVSEQEWDRLLSMSVLLFLLFVGVVFGRSCRDAFFIKEAGYQNLPYMYILNALLMVIVSGVYSQVVDRLPRFRFLIYILLGCIGTIIFLRVLMVFDHFTMPYIVFGITEVMLIIPLIHFWTFGNDVFDPREGKRVFPLIGSLGLIGTLLGGVLTKIVAQTAGAPNIFVAWIAILLICLPVGKWAHKTYLSSGKETSASKRILEHKEDQSGFSQNITDVWKIPLIRTLAYIHIPMYIVIYIVDFQFFLSLSEAIKDQDQMAGFLGLFASLWSLSAILLLFTGTGRLLQRFGVGRVALVHPASVTLGTIALLVRNLLPIPVGGIYSIKSGLGIFAKFSHIGIKYSFDEPSNQLLYNSIRPEKRGRSRAFITGTVKPLSIALSGVFLVVFIKILRVDITIISIITVGLSALWLILSLKIRSEYLQAMVENLNSNNIELRDGAIKELSQIKIASSRKKLLEAVLSTDDNTSIYAIRLLNEILDTTLAGELCEMLPRVRNRVKPIVFAVLSNLGTPDVISSLCRELESPESGIRASAIKYLGRIGDKSVAPLLRNLLNDSDIDIRAEAIGALIRIEKIFDLNHDTIKILLEMTRDPESSVQAKSAYIIREVGGSRLMPLLLQLAESDDERVQYEVIGALGETRDSRAVPALIGFLGHRNTLLHVVEALVHLGDLAAELIQVELRSGRHDDDLKNKLIFCLGQIGYTSTIPCLVEHLEGQPSLIQYSALNALCAIREKTGEEEKGEDRESRTLSPQIKRVIYRKLSEIVEDIKKDTAHIAILKNLQNERATILLIDTMERENQHRIEMALKCLSLVADSQTIRTAINNLKSSDERIRSESIEVIDGSCNEARELAKILEGRHIPMMKASRDITPTTLFKELLLRENKRKWFYVCLIHAIGLLKIAGLQSEIRRFVDHSDILIRNTALSSAMKIGIPVDGRANKKEIEKMELEMDRILFLRSVPLFGDIDGRDLRWINEIAIEKSYTAGDIVFRENDEGDALYIIVSGSVKIIKGSDNPILLTILEERDYFGEMAILDQDLRSATVEVNEDVELLMIRRDHFQSLLLSRPQIAFAIFKSFSRRIRQLQYRLLESQEPVERAI